MKTWFSFSLKGRDWWKPFLLYWVLYIILSSPSQRYSRENMFAGAGPGVHTGMNIVFSIGLFILQAVYTIVFLRIVMPGLSVGGKSFYFRGNIGVFLKIHIRGILLTIITLTIYGPWYARRVTEYLVNETTFDGETPEFLGSAKKLLKYFILSFWLPVIILMILFGVTIYNSAGGQWVGSFDFSRSVVTFWTFFLVFIMFVVLVPFFYLVYSWYVNLRWKDVHVSWQTSFWPSCGFILGQLLLSVLTAGIYWPAAMLKLFRYFAGKTVLQREEHTVGRLGFEGNIGKGFGLIWGQTLLCIITLGVYIPWAVERVGKWTASVTCHEELQAGT